MIPTTTRHVWVVRQTGGGTGFEVERDYDLSTVVLPGDKIISALPDWSGRLWFASTNGVVGTVDPASGAVRSRPLGEKIANSFAVEDTGAVYIVTDAALYRLAAGAGGVPPSVWRVPYENSGVQKPGQASAGSGTTPTLMGDGLVAITDNADPMNVLVYRRGSGQRICRQPVFERGASATDQSLIGTGRSLVVENNYGYAGPTATQGGKTTSPGLERVDLDAGGGCHSAWRSAERAPSVVPKLSARNGHRLHVHEGPAPDPSVDAWYLTALDFAHRPHASTSASAARAWATTTTTPRSRSGPTGPPTSARWAGWWRCATRRRRRGRGTAARRAVAGSGGCGCTCGGWGASACGCG